MKKKHIFLALVSIAIFFVNLSSAHSPADISIDYNFETDILTVTVDHVVSTPDTHYIELLDVWVNDILNVSRPYSRQTETTYHQDTFNITAEHGDVIKIKAHCNVSGSLIKEFILQDPIIPEFGLLAPLLLFILAGSIIGLIITQKKN